MKTVQPPSPRYRRSVLSTLALGLLFALSGCDTMGAFVNGDLPHYTESACQVQGCWQPNVLCAADSVHRGAQLPGIAGRVYLFGPQIGFPLVGDNGKLIVGLFDATPRPGQTEPVELEEWKLDSESLKLLLKKDMIGWGYTVFLPWASYKPDITQVVMKVRYDQPNRAPVFSESELTLDPTNVPPQVTQSVRAPQGTR
jgi:hypothetical protein